MQRSQLFYVLLIRCSRAKILSLRGASAYNGSMRISSRSLGISKPTIASIAVGTRALRGSDACQLGRARLENQKWGRLLQQHYLTGLHESRRAAYWG